jgi:aminocarboxymuconate-semialdehyde decarboxylase
MIVDMHAHLYPERYMEELARSGGRYGVGIERGADGRRFLRFEGIRYRWYVEPFYDVGQRLALLDAAGVDRQVLSMGPPMVFWADPALGARLSRLLNEEISRVVEQFPERFVAFAAVPLQDTALALAEREHAVGGWGTGGWGSARTCTGSRWTTRTWRRSGRRCRI